MLSHQIAPLGRACNFMAESSRMIKIAPPGRLNFGCPLGPIKLARHGGFLESFLNSNNPKINPSAKLNKNNYNNYVKHINYKKDASKEKKNLEIQIILKMN